MSEMQAELEVPSRNSNSFIASDLPAKSTSTSWFSHDFWRRLTRVGILRQLFSSEKGISQGLFSLADQGVASVTNFVSGVILARATSKQEFGLYMLAFSLVLIVTDIQTSLIATPYMVYGPRLKGRASALYSGSTLIHQALFSALVMCGIAVGALVARLGWGPPGIWPVLLVLVAAIAPMMFREFVRRMCFARLKVKSALVFDTGIGVAQVGGLLILARLGLLSTTRAYWLIGAACAIGVAAWSWGNRASYRPRLRAAVNDLKLNWTFGRWVFASGLLWAASTNLFPWLLAYFHGTEAAGIFAAVSGVVAAGNPALLGLQNFVGPRVAHEFASGGPRALRRLAIKISALVALPVLALTFALMVWGDHLVGMLYGHQYMGNRLAISILACNLPIIAVAFTFSRALFAIERADLDFWLNLIALLMMATVGIWLVRGYGTPGAALGLVVSSLVPSCARIAVFLRSTAHASLPGKVACR